MVVRQARVRLESPESGTHNVGWMREGALGGQAWRWARAGNVKRVYQWQIQQEAALGLAEIRESSQRGGRGEGGQVCRGGRA